MLLPPNSLTIGYIHPGSDKDPFLRSLWDFRLIDSTRRKVWLDADLLGVSGLYLDNNRNAIVEDFLQRSHKEALLFIDTDISFDPAVVYALIEVLDPKTRPIVSGFYAVWYHGKLVPEWWDYNTTQGFVHSTLKSELELQELDACGMGFCLIHRSVFDQYPVRDGDPWRWFGRDLGMVEGKRCRLDEDLTFCKRARFDLNIPIFGHGRSGFLIRHHKEVPISLELMK